VHGRESIRFEAEALRPTGSVHARGAGKGSMCNLYSLTKGQAAIIALTRALRDSTGNLPPLPGIFTDTMAPVVRNAPDGVRELMMARWGMPSSQFALMQSVKAKAAKLEAKAQPVDFKEMLRMSAIPARPTSATPTANIGSGRLARSLSCATCDFSHF
jgi:hypothetical protein